MNTPSKPPFQGIELHHMGYFPICFLDRCEDYGTTLNMFQVSSEFVDNTNILNRPTHVFRNSPAVFELLRQKAIEDQDFIKVEIVEDNSDLGFPCYFYAKHKSGEEVLFDGVIFRISLKITDDEFYLKDAISLMGYPFHPKAIQSLNKAIIKVNPDFPYSVYTFRKFYTALKTDWQILGIKADGNPSMQISINDQNLLTVTALDYVEYGKKYNFYIGSYEEILQIIAHDLYQSIEIGNWRNYISSKVNKANKCFQQASDAFVELSKPFHYIKSKLKTWSEAKKGFIYLLQELPLLYRYKLLIETYEKIANDKLSSINGRRQIFIYEDEYDNRSAIAYWAKYFFSGEIKNEKISNISNEPISPGYTNDIQLLKNDIKELERTVQDSFSLSKDLFASAQTEFSAYSIWLAITAIIISAILGFIPFFISSSTNASGQSRNQSELSLPSSRL